ncbi:MAG: ribose-5-phosphate isomerase RpiA [Rhizobiaceae bacterium]|nr:ribose-5-phosphate isomerase RpiA [Rhizobiaceae bacterium]
MSEDLKTLVGQAVCEYVLSGMRLGIGTGSTAEAFVHALAQKVNEGLEVVGVPTSERTAKLCKSLGIALTSLEETPELDLTIDGADEVDANLSLTKGGGGALLREKIVAAASKSMYVIADESKLVKYLGAFALPIEVNRFGLAATRIAIEKLANSFNLHGDIQLRRSVESIFETDGGHYILDASFGLIHDASALDSALLAIPGVVQHGLFINMADKVFVAGKDGVRILEREQ